MIAIALYLLGVLAVLLVLGITRRKPPVTSEVESFRIRVVDSGAKVDNHRRAA